MDFIDPFDKLEENTEITGWEPVLGGQLAEKAVWVDEAKCCLLYTSPSPRDS